MSEVKVKIEGKKFTITGEIGEGKVSSTGKSMVMASSGGFTPIPGTDLRFNLTIIKK